VYKKKLLFWLLFALASICNLYTHYFAFFPLFSTIIFSVALLYKESAGAIRGDLGNKKKSRFCIFLKDMIPLSISVVVIMIIFLLWFSFTYKALINLRGWIIPTQSENDSGINITFRFLVNLMNQIGFGNGIALLVSFILFLMGISFLLNSHRFIDILLIFSFFIPPFLVIWQIKPQIFHHRYVIYLIPIYIFPIAFGLSNIMRLLWSYKPKKTFLKLVFPLSISFFIILPILLGSYKKITYRYSEGMGWDMKSPYQLILDNYKPNDLILASDLKYAFGWYFDKPLPNLESQPYDSLEEFMKKCEKSERVWVGGPSWVLNNKQIVQYLRQNFFMIPFKRYRLFFKSDEKDPILLMKERIKLIRNAIQLSPNYLPLRQRLRELVSQNQ